MSLSVTNEALPVNLCEAKIIADSVSESSGHRVTTFEVNMHRFVLAEFNTHRVFSRNSASSRAIPVPKRMNEFELTPAFSLNLPAEKAGMQGGEELDGRARDDAVQFLRNLHRLTAEEIQTYLDQHPAPSDRLHKSVLARYMEPWLWHRVIVTATDWSGFFEQRVSSLAQPEIHYPAMLMSEAFDKSTPVTRSAGDWHLPYVRTEECERFNIFDLVRLSTARCARVSYLTHDGDYDPEKDLNLWSRLVTADPAHASPLEHPCMVDDANERTASWSSWDGGINTKRLPMIGNLIGWMQARHLVLGF